MTTTVTEQEELLTLLSDALETIDEGIAVYDANETLVFCNRLYKEYLGPVAHLAVPGIQWRTFMRAYLDAGLEAANYDPNVDFDEQADQLRASEVPRKSQVSAEGRQFEVSFSPMSAGGFVLRRKDVTDRVEAEAAAEDHAALLTCILETNPIPVVMARLEDGKIVWRSPAAAELVGENEYSTGNYFDPKDREEYVAQLRRDGLVEDFRMVGQPNDGRVGTFALSGRLTEFGGETCVVSSITDLSETQQREALMRKVIEACPAPVLMNRAGTGEILYRSPELIALFGDSLDAGTFYADPADRQSFLDTVRRDGEVTEYRARMKNAAGQPFWAAISGRLTEWEGHEVLVTFTRDLTPQLKMETELDRQRDLSFQSEKMSALGSLLAGVAHELNNPLSVVVGHAMMLEEETADAQSRRQIRKISAAAERCARIVKTFLAMARQEPAQMNPVDLNEVVRVASEVAEYGDGAHAVSIKSDLLDGLPTIEGDADQLTQLVLNLIINAEDAIAASGQGARVTLKTSGVEDAVRLEVVDDGPGVPAEMRKRVFEPFFTTKDVGEGTGLGLSMCHQIASSHRGTIQMTEAKGGGARVVIDLPASDPSPAIKPKTGPVEDTNQKALRVLIVDDETDVAELNSEVLTRAGYHTSHVVGGRDALRRLDEEEFDIVLSDLNMPDLDGRSVFEAITERHPHLVSGVGFVTGDTLGRTSQSFLAEAGRPYLEKPVSPTELRDFVGKLHNGTLT